MGADPRRVDAARDTRIMPEHADRDYPRPCLAGGPYLGSKDGHRYDEQSGRARPPPQMGTSSLPGYHRWKKRRDGRCYGGIWVAFVGPGFGHDMDVGRRPTSGKR